MESENRLACGKAKRSRDQSITCALHKLAQGGKEAVAQIADIENGQIHQLNDGKHGIVRRGEVNPRRLELGEDALG